LTNGRFLDPALRCQEPRSPDGSVILLHLTVVGRITVKIGQNAWSVNHLSDTLRIRGAAPRP